MLIDQIYAADCPYFTAVADVEEIRAVLKGAKVFVLDRDFAAAADELCNKKNMLMSAMKFCRLPFKTCWIEVAHNDRTSFVGGTPAGRNEAVPKRVGFLLEAPVPKFPVFSATLFWEFYRNEPRSSSRLNFSATSLLLDPLKSGILDALLQYQSAPKHAECSPFINRFANPGLKKAEEIPGGLDRLVGLLSERGVSDWKGEAAYLLATLALLNSRNIGQTVEIDSSEFKKSEQKYGRRPFFSYSLCKLSSHCKKVITRLLDAGVGGAGIRAHFVRGHFKVRKSGIFWWSDFARGDPSLGFADKDYSVHA